MIERVDNARWPTLVFFASLALFAIRGIGYGLLGSYVPAMFAGSFIALVSVAYFSGRRSTLWAVRLWAIVLVLYAIARIGLGVMLMYIDVDSSHADESTGVPFLLFSVGYFATGIYLWQQARMVLVARAGSPKNRVEPI